MAADLKNYLVAKSQGTVGNGRGSNKFSSSATKMRNTQSSMAGTTTSSFLSPIIDGHKDLRGDRLTRNMVVNTSQMKPLNDSDYLMPHQNYRVIQDNDPIKGETWKNALMRHESQVSATKDFNKTVMNSHFGKVKGDELQIKDDNETLKQKR